MKKTIIAIGICITGDAFAQQNQPDSIHIMLHENQNGNIRVLDTIVPISQQQQLFMWMENNGWDTPPPPSPPGTDPIPFEHIIVIEGDSGHTSHGERHVMIMKGSCDSIPALPPGSQVRKKQEHGDMIYMRMPAPPPAPGSDVKVNVVEKDTMIDGKPHKMIIRTERIILPEGIQAPPIPPMPPKAPTPANGKTSAPANGNRDLVVYPNPTSEIITVEFDVAPKEKTTLQIVDMTGKIIYSEQIFDEQGKHIYREINLSGKGKGTYTVEVKSAKKVIAEKIILQ